MTPWNAFLRAIQTLRNYHLREYTHVKMHGEHYTALIHELTKNMGVAGTMESLLGFYVEVDCSVPKENVIFHSPHFAGVARIPWHGDL
jgi:hypothetical protein